MKLFRDKWPFLALILAVFIFFRFLFVGQLPIPADTIIGLYHPFRDLYAREYPRGLPFKNFLITDPVRQLYPWRELGVNLLKQKEIPFWNPYSFSGTPLLSNFQAAVFYPLNFLFLLLLMTLGWSILIITQPLLAGLFLYLYLRNLKISKIAGFLGAISFSFSGFFIAWLEWGTILHTLLWLPLILLAVDKIFFKPRIIWVSIFIFSLIFSFFAGHLQVAFYVIGVSLIYFLVRWWQNGRKKHVFLLFIINYLLFIVITSIQWLPTFQFINLSGRGLDQIDWQKADWFLPFQNLAQFIAPDFFGNPTTLNYFGIWNYGEFIGYIGILPLIFIFYALFYRRDKKTLFFSALAFLSLLFLLPNPISFLPYTLKIPFLSTSQPTRLMGILDFSLAILAAFGFDLFLRKTNLKKTFSVVLFLGLTILGLWIVAQFLNFEVSKRNLLLPTILFAVSSLLLIIFPILKDKRIKSILIVLILGITVFDLLRFGEKFTPFTKKEYLFPQTKTLEFLKNKEKENGVFRFMTTDSRIFPPNFSIIYRLQSVDGYDPLYLARYGELIAASERGEANIKTPFGFNRIITPHRVDSKIMNLLNVKYILSLEEETSGNLKKVFQEGETRVYENKNVLPRAFFVSQIELAENKKMAIQMMFREDFDFWQKAVVEGSLIHNSNGGKLNIGKVKIISYSENKVILETENEGDGFLVLVDTFYPTWQVKIAGKKSIIYRTDYNFRGVFVPAGKQQIEFYEQWL